MAISRRRRWRGFWRGVFAGLLLAVAIGVGLALVFPPWLFMPPEITPGLSEPPEGPARPGSMARPVPPRDAPLLMPEAAGPIIVLAPGDDPAPDLQRLAPPPTPDVYLGGDAGSPSLVPPAQ